MKHIYSSPIGLSVDKHDWDDQYTITGNAKREMTIKEFDSAYDFEEFIQEKINCNDITFDSEYCQFFAYAKTEAQAINFIKAIETHFSKVREMLGAE